MSTAPAVTMQELELEHAELLPPRETLSSGVQAGSGNTAQSGLVNVSAANGSLNHDANAGSNHGPSSDGAQAGDGNTAQSGLVNVSAANGNLNHDASVGSGNTA
jgi:hypothetical protein